MCLSLEGQVYPKLWVSPTPFTQCPIHFLSHSPSVPSTFFYPSFKLPTQTSIFFSTLMSGWLVLMVSLGEWIFVVVLWFFLYCGVWFSSFLLLFSYPIHPVYLQLSFTPHLKSLTKPNLSVLVLVKVMRNSTHKVGWQEWETNQCYMASIQIYSV